MGLVPAGTLPVELETTGAQSMRTTAILTDTLAACNNDFYVGNENHVEFSIALTKAALASFTYKIQQSQTGVTTDFHDLTNEETAGGTGTTYLDAGSTIQTAAMGATHKFLIQRRIALPYVRLLVSGPVGGNFAGTDCIVTGIANHI